MEGSAFFKVLLYWLRNASIAWFALARLSLTVAVLAASVCTALR